jgi:hypothetical protein
MLMEYLCKRRAAARIVFSQPNAPIARPEFRAQLEVGVCFGVAHIHIVEYSQTLEFVFGFKPSSPDKREAVK